MYYMHKCVGYNCLYKVLSAVYMEPLLDVMCHIVILFTQLTRHDTNSCTNTDVAF